MADERNKVLTNIQSKVLPIQNKHKLLRKKILEYWRVYVLLIPVVTFYILFCYAPMYGIVVAFKDYLASRGIMGSDWAGFVHFEKLFTTPKFAEAFRNTLVISGLKLVFCFPFPILLALFLNEIVSPKLKKAIQTAIYLPNFISWVIIAGIMYSILSVNGGVVNNIRIAMGLEAESYMTKPAAFYPILILSEIWKGAGWGTVIYISAITGINPEIYEAAEVDGCKRLAKMRYITLPGIQGVVVIMFILAIGNIMNAGFDPVFNLSNRSVLSVAEILDTLAYRIGISSGEVEQGAALGLFKTIINFVLLLGANFLVKRINGYGIYS